MLAAASSLSSFSAQPAVSQGAALPSAYQRPARSQRQQRQRLLEWDRDVTTEARRSAAAEGERSEADAPIRHPLSNGPRRMAEVMPAVLARYGL